MKPKCEFITNPTEAQIQKCAKDINMSVEQVRRELKRAGKMWLYASGMLAVPDSELLADYFSIPKKA